MNLAQVIEAVSQTFSESYFIQSEDGDYFFLYGSDNRFPFATVVTHDNEYDHVSKLDREGYYRLNIGIGKERFNALFAHIEAKSGIGGYWEAEIDFTKENEIFPHPVYGNMYWVSVVNPTDETFKTLLLPYLQYAYEKAVEKDKKNNSN
ncbi:DUF6194 family protein [Rapidithrix thailandica]|uniref:DUF6194 family protein n=1 Tax=Rapidithrix thailandica TaxID=413964 RepID=A0AAW9SG51_9BACT